MEMDDPQVARLSNDTRALLGGIWAERARSELGAGSGFAQVLVGLYSVGASPVVIALAAEAAAQEVEHARACHRLAEHYLGAPVVMPTPKRVSMPAHRGADDPLRAHLHVIGLCCMNESVAADFVAQCLDVSGARLVRESCSTHLRDEIGHARVGWAHLGTGMLDTRDRQEIERHLPRMVFANASLWIERLQMLPEDGVVGHGYPPRALLHASALKAFETLVIEGLAACQFDVTASRRELKRLA